MLNKKSKFKAHNYLPCPLESLWNDKIFKQSGLCRTYQRKRKNWTWNLKRKLRLTEGYQASFSIWVVINKGRIFMKFFCLLTWNHNFLVAHFHNQCYWKPDKPDDIIFPRDQRTIKLESIVWQKRTLYNPGREQDEENYSVGKRDMMKIFLPVSEDRMWLQVWLELEKHFAFAIGWERWVMASSHLWGKCCDRTTIYDSTVAWTYRGLQSPSQLCSEQPAVLWIRYEQPWAAINGSLRERNQGRLKI